MAIRIKYGASPGMLMAAGYQTGRDRRKEREEERFRKTAAQERMLQYRQRERLFDRQTRVGLEGMKIKEQKERDVRLGVQQAWQTEREARHKGWQDWRRAGYQGQRDWIKQVYRGRQSEAEQKAAFAQKQVAGLSKTMGSELAKIDVTRLPNAVRTIFNDYENAYTDAMRLDVKGQENYLPQLFRAFRAAGFDKHMRPKPTPTERFQEGFVPVPPKHGGGFVLYGPTREQRYYPLKPGQPMTFEESMQDPEKTRDAYERAKKHVEARWNVEDGGVMPVNAEEAIEARMREEWEEEDDRWKRLSGQQGQRQGTTQQNEAPSPPLYGETSGLRHGMTDLTAPETAVAPRQSQAETGPAAVLGQPSGLQRLIEAARAGNRAAQESLERGGVSWQ